jgi:hypothetical protein
MDQFAGARRGAFRKITLLTHEDAEAAARRIPGNPGAIDATANDNEIDCAPVLHVSTG